MNTPSYTFINLNRKTSANFMNKYVGGGVCIGVHKSLIFKNLELLLPSELKEQEILFV